MILQFLCGLKSAKLGFYANQNRSSPACCGAQSVLSMQTVPSKQMAGTGPGVALSFPSGIAHQVHLHRLLPACWFSCVALLQRPLCTIRKEICAWKSSSIATCSRCSLPSVFYLCVCGPNSTGRANGSKTSISLNEKCSETNLLLIFRLSWGK